MGWASLIWLAVPAGAARVAEPELVQSLAPELHRLRQAPSLWVGPSFVTGRSLSLDRPRSGEEEGAGARKDQLGPAQGEGPTVGTQVGLTQSSQPSELAAGGSARASVQAALEEEFGELQFREREEGDQR